MIIGLSGKARAGKDTVADILVKNHCFEKVALADPMKDICRMLFGFTDEQLRGKEKELVDPRYGISPRFALQTLGSDWGRTVYQDVWVDYTMREARKRLAYYKCDGVCISDVRFKNEYDAVKAAGGQVWRIIRPGAGLAGAAGLHPSENDLTDDGVYDRVINNQDGSLEDLAAIVARVIGGKQ